ncbi:MAG TPA: hypothetical protein VGP48_02060 [Stellaceae bacterium]|jgi:hypothetical protein|nr:hypothetical protein [Stellaceae bacterium]
MQTHSLASYVIAVLIVLAVLNAAAWYFAGPDRLRDIAIYSGGFLMGMLAMWIAVHVYR